MKKEADYGTKWDMTSDREIDERPNCDHGQEWGKKCQDEQRTYSFSFWQLTKTQNPNKNLWWTRDFFFLFCWKMRSRKTMMCASWGFKESKQAIRVFIRPYCQHVSNERKHKVEWCACFSRRHRMESNETDCQLAERRQGKRGQRQHTPNAAHRDISLQLNISPQRHEKSKLW